MSVVKLIYCMRAKAKKNRADYYNAFKVHITTKVSRKCWHSALLTYAAIENSRSFVKSEVSEEGDCCYRLAVKTKKKARSIEVWVYRALANVLKKTDLKPKEAYVVECVDSEKSARQQSKSKIPCAQVWICNFVSSW